jgi:D-beta-D-heptose 7-phosphate kinase/D-beta-D-heptose 1-phosphate adenosyltransferase
MTQTRLSPRLLSATVDRWQGRSVLVVGDVMLDDWRFTEPRRLYREAPAPVLTLRRQVDAAGGAGNTAVNLAALGARPLLVAPVGDDRAEERIGACLARAGVADGTSRIAGGRTPTKRRLIATDQILSCEEELAAGTDTPQAATQLLGALERALPDTGERVDLVICDYGLGALSDPVRRWLCTHRDRFALVTLDAHDLAPWSGLAPTAVTPSFAEATPLLGVRAPGTASGDRAAMVAAGAARLLWRTGAQIAAVTLDVDGALVVTKSGDRHRTRSTPVPASRTVGAGDAYLATFALALAVHATAPVAAELAQLAATAALHGTGTCVCTRAGLLAALPPSGGPHQGRILDAAELVRLVRTERARGARIVFTNGCFDMLHSGHVGYLAEARALGDLLIVAVNSDASVRRLKGPQRPINAVRDRVAVLAALACVDAVVVFEDDSPAALIESVRPDVYVKGGDYPPELVPEAPLVRRLGGEVHTLGYVPDRSTSSIIERIRSRRPLPEPRPSQ